MKQTVVEKLNHIYTRHFEIPKLLIFKDCKTENQHGIVVKNGGLSLIIYYFIFPAWWGIRNPGGAAGGNLRRGSLYQPQEERGNGTQCCIALSYRGCLSASSCQLPKEATQRPGKGEVMKHKAVLYSPSLPAATSWPLQGDIAPEKASSTQGRGEEWNARQPCIPFPLSPQLPLGLFRAILL